MSDAEIVTPNAEGDVRSTETSKSNEIETPVQSTIFTDTISPEKSTTAAPENQSAPIQPTEVLSEPAKDTVIENQTKAVAENVAAPVVKTDDQIKTQIESGTEILAENVVAPAVKTDDQITTQIESQSQIVAENVAAPVVKTDDQIKTQIEIQTEIGAENVASPVVKADDQRKMLIENQTGIVTENVIAPVVKMDDEIRTQKSPNEEAKENSEKISNVGELESMGAGDPCSQKVENAPAIATNETSATTTDSSVITKNAQIDNPPIAKPTEVNLNEQTISKLQTAVQKMTQERDSYKKKLDVTEKRLGALQTSYDDVIKGGGDELTLRRMMEQLKVKLIQTSLQLEDRVRVVANQEKQISALNNQVASLKEVEALTRSLLQIRNMEVKHLQTEVDAMEVRITEERDRYNTMINKMDAAVKLNADLKKEYETQLGLFRDLREKYEEKVTLLSEEKRALETAAQTVPN